MNDKNYTPGETIAALGIAYLVGVCVGALAGFVLAWGMCGLGG